MWIQAILLGTVLLTELVLLPESLVSAPGYRAITASNPSALVLQAPWGGSPFINEKSPRPIDSVIKTLRAVTYVPAWLAGLAFAVPYGCELAVNSTLP
jgi:hypothetical protein